jgi:thiol-disulfide isomerase/thioredoxin
VPTAQALAQRGIEVWQPDLHAAFFLPPGRYSLVGIEPQLIGELIGAAVERSGKRVFVAAAGRSAALALTGIRAWQAQTTHPERLGGAVLLHPNLYRRTPQGGESGEYLPVTRATTVPIYLFQPDQSAAYWRVGELVAALEAGGASVFVQRLRDAADGFNTRPDFEPAEAALTARLPAMLDQALTLLAAVPGSAPSQALAADTLDTPQREQRSELLRPYADPKPAPALQLPDLDGGRHDLADLAGRVVLVNFWATWCPPCVEEIPSLQRLYQKLHPAGLEILAVDVGESADQVRGFLAHKLPQTQVSFPVLLDPEGAAFKAWQAYAFPTTLILDRRQRIRYAVFGAFAWDSPEVVQTLRALLAETPRDSR